MEWHHLYARGAVEDQSVMLLRCFDVIHRHKAAYEEEKSEKREKEAQAKQRSNPRGGSRPRGGRRR